MKDHESHQIDNPDINRAIEYIYEHIDEKITVDDVCNYCNFSKAHFSRIFKAETGEGLYEFVKRNRLARSATAVKAFPDIPITEIAMDAGYSSSNFSTAFKMSFDKNPAEYRASKMTDGYNHPYLDMKCVLKSFEEYDKDMEILLLPDRRVHYNRFDGEYSKLRNHWCRFMEEMAPYRKPETLFLERSFCDSDVVPSDKCMCDVCMVLEEGLHLEPETFISGGLFAKYHFKGSRDDIFATYQGLTCVWLPNSGYSLDKRDFFDQNFAYDEVNDIIEMYIHVPITRNAES